MIDLFRQLKLEYKNAKKSEEEERYIDLIKCIINAVLQKSKGNLLAKVKKCRMRREENS